jgi:hypothetical protein
MQEQLKTSNCLYIFKITFTSPKNEFKHDQNLLEYLTMR